MSSDQVPWKGEVTAVHPRFRLFAQISGVGMVLTSGPRSISCPNIWFLRFFEKLIFFFAQKKLKSVTTVTSPFKIQRGRNLETTDTFAPRLFPGPPSVCKYRSPRNMKLVLHGRIYCDPTIWEFIWTCFWVINVAKLFHVLFILFQHFCSLLLRCYCGPMTKNWCEYKASLKFSLSDFNIFITNVTF